MASIGSKSGVGSIMDSVVNSVFKNFQDGKKVISQPSGTSTIKKEIGKGGGSSDGGTPSATTTPTQGTTYKAPGMDDLGQVDYSKQWDSTLSGGGASYDEMEKIYKDRQDKINSGDPYGQFAGDAKSKEMEAWLQANKPKTPSGGGSDYSGYIEDMYAAKQKAALDALRNAYEKNVLGLDRAQAAIAPQYQSARNEAAGQAELQKKNFAEYAAANGLNSGAGGQAQLSFANALQSNLSGIAQKEASTMADLELQRSQMETDYNNAIAQAESQGNYELAQQLYAEMVRQDEAMRAQMQWQAQQDLQKDQLAWNKEQATIGQGQWQQSFDKGNEQYNREWAYKVAQDSGDFDILKIFGVSDETIVALKKRWEQGNYGDGGYRAVRADTGKPVSTGIYGDETDRVAEDDTQRPSGTGMSDANFKGVKQTVYTWLKSGDVDRALEVANQTWSALTQVQREELKSYFDGMGYILG